MVDNVIQGKTRTRREFCSFYTESDPILTYMVTKLNANKNDLILEPCAGDGVFIEKLLSLDKYNIHAVDLNPKAVSGLKNKFANQNVKVWQADTLIDFNKDLFSQNNFSYNKIIGNPPYGAWQDEGKRKLLKNIYGGYVKETYTLFIRKCIDLLSENGRLVFIIPDTFLALRMHEDTRREILEKTKIEEILLIPSNFFPGVNFGYSNLCIISLTKTKPTKNHSINIVSVQNSIEDLYEVAKGNYTTSNYYEKLIQNEVFETEGKQFLLGGTDKVRSIIRNADVTLGNLADCVTGFYSGDNKKFIQVLNENIRGSKGYQIANPKEVDLNYLNQKDIIKGLSGKKKSIPFLKSASGTLFKSTDWFIKWDKDAVEGYKKSKVARFQNSNFYFKQGIGVPMIKSSKIHAVLLDHRLFDQSVVGVFPKEEKYTNYLLAFLNSETCSKLLKVINHTANNSANYLKKLPIILDKKAILEIDKVIDEFKNDADTEVTLRKINQIFNTLYKI
jgi:adenine-specific DNA-methyltransferase